MPDCLPEAPADVRERDVASSALGEGAGAMRRAVVDINPWLFGRPEAAAQELCAVY